MSEAVMKTTLAFKVYNLIRWIISYNRSAMGLFRLHALGIYESILEEPQVSKRRTSEDSVEQAHQLTRSHIPRHLSSSPSTARSSHLHSSQPAHSH